MLAVDVHASAQLELFENVARAKQAFCSCKRMNSLVESPVSADNAVTSRDLRILVDQATEPVASSDADVVLRRRGGDLAVGWSLAEGPVRPVGVVVIDVFAEGVVEMSPAGDEDAVGALAAGAGDPALADGVRARCLDRRLDNLHAGCGEDSVKARRCTWHLCL